MRIPRDEMLQVNGVELCVETFGDPDDPALLLVMGSGASMDWWEEDWCARLAAGGRFVIRYDHRDTGRSVSYPPGAPPYTLRDLVCDAVAVLDVLGVERAHVVGMSMGGAIAQLAALDHGDRVASLTLIGSSPAGPGAPDLPSMPPDAVERFASIEAPDWGDRAAVVDHVVAVARASASPSGTFDEAAFRALAGRVFDCTTSMEASMTNHAVMESGDGWRERLPTLDVPTLVLHGVDDPVLPYGHGLALAREIPGARLLALERTGHELPRAAWDVAIPAILAHTEAASAVRA